MIKFMKNIYIEKNMTNKFRYLIENIVNFNPVDYSDDEQNIIDN